MLEFIIFYFNLMSQEKQTTAKLCLKCHDMYGNPNFNQMCSLCYKQTLAEAKQLEQKQENCRSCTPNELNQLLGKKTEIQKIQKIEISTIIKAKSDCKIEKIEKREENKQQKQVIKQIPKCARCHKKVGMLGYSCKHCSQEFCKIHRIPEDHDCKVDFISQGRKQLKMENPNMKKAKIDHI